MLLYTFICICLQEQPLYLKKNLYDGQQIFNQSSEAGKNPAYAEDLCVSGRCEFHRRKIRLFQVQDWPCKDICRFYS